MNNNIKIERMTKEDIMLYAQKLEAFDDVAWVNELFNEFSNDPFAYFFKAYWNEEFAGYCAIYHNTMNAQHYCKIMDLEVMPTMRRKGIGKALMYKIIELSKELRLTQIKLEVDTKNSSALEMYKSLNFQIERTEKEYYDDGGDAYIMSRYDS